MKIVIYALLMIFVSLFSYAAGESAGEGQSDVVNERLSVTEDINEIVIPKYEELLPDVVERVLPSVVGVEAVERNKQGASLGSGVIVSKKGYIITNHHVVGDEPYRTGCCRCKNFSRRTLCCRNG